MIGNQVAAVYPSVRPSDVQEADVTDRDRTSRDRSTDVSKLTFPVQIVIAIVVSALSATNQMNESINELRRQTQLLQIQYGELSKQIGQRR